MANEERMSQTHNSEISPASSVEFSQENFAAALGSEEGRARLLYALGLRKTAVEHALQQGGLTEKDLSESRGGFASIHWDLYNMRLAGLESWLRDLEGENVPVGDQVAAQRFQQWRDTIAMSNDVLSDIKTLSSAGTDVEETTAPDAGGGQGEVFDSSKAYNDARERLRGIEREIADAIQANVAFDFDAEGTKDDVLHAIDPQVMSDMQLHGKRILKMLDAENKDTFSEQDERDIHDLIDKFEVLKEESLSGIKERGAQSTVEVNPDESGVAGDQIKDRGGSVGGTALSMDEIKRWGKDARAESPVIIAAQDERNLLEQKREVERANVLKLAAERRDASKKSLEAKYPGAFARAPHITEGVRRIAAKSKIGKRSVKVALAALAFLVAGTTELNRDEGVFVKPPSTTELPKSDNELPGRLSDEYVPPVTSVDVETEFHSENIDVVDTQQPSPEPLPAVAEIPKREIGPDHTGVLNQGPGDSYLTVPQVGQEEIAEGVQSEVTALPKSDNELPGRLSDEYVPPVTSSGTETESISSAPDIIDEGVTTVPDAQENAQEPSLTQPAVENIAEVQSDSTSASENFTYIVQPEDDKGIWNIMEGSGPDANPTGGQSHVLSGIPRTDRTADLNRLVAYMEQHPDFTRSVGVESGNPHKIRPGEILQISAMDQMIEQLRGGGAGTSDIPIPEIRPDSSVESRSAANADSTAEISVGSQNTSETNAGENIAPEVKVPHADVVQRQMETLVAGVEKTSGGFLGLGASDIRGTYTALAGTPLSQLSELTTSNLAELNVSEKGFEKWANTIDTYASVLPYRPTETLSQYVTRYVEHMNKNSNAT